MTRAGDREVTALLSRCCRTAPVVNHRANGPMRGRAWVRGRRAG
jgi:hypothetical protein